MVQQQQVYKSKDNSEQVMCLDIERLKKLNALAGELKHQGIASNHEDAAFLAVTMVGESEEQALSDMHINDDQSLVIREIIKDKPQIKQEEHAVEQKKRTSNIAITSSNRRYHAAHTAVHEKCHDSR